MTLDDVHLDQLFFARVFLFGLTSWATVLVLTELVFDLFSALWLGLLVAGTGWLFIGALYQLAKQGWQ